MSGIFDNIECLKDARPYKDMSVADFKEHLYNFMTNPPETNQKRDLFVLTGSAGAEMFHAAFQKQAYYDMLELMKISISIQEYDRIKSLMDSPDKENFEIAKLIIDHLSADGNPTDRA